MAENDLATVRRVVAGLNRGGIDSVRDEFDPEVEYVEDPKFPEAETYRGLEAVAGQWRQFAASFEGYRTEIEELYAVADKAVAVFHERGQGRASGAPVDRMTGWVFGFRDGKVARMEIFLDAADAPAAAGVSPPRPR